MKKIVDYENFLISENLKYHVENGFTLDNNQFRPGSDSYFKIITEARKLYNEGKLKCDNEREQIILEKLQTGTKAVTRDGKSVTLDYPRRNNSNPKKKYYVYHSTGKKNKDGKIIAKKIEWGHPDYKVKNYDKDAAKSFWARMNCDNAKDQSKPKYWACWAPTLFTKELGFKSDRHW